MILKFRHKGLRRLFEQDDPSGVKPDLSARLKRVLFLLDHIERAEDINLPGYRLHPLKGDLAGFWSVTVSGNWRVIFQMDGADVTQVDLVDYH